VRKGYVALPALVLVCAALLAGCAAPWPFPQPPPDPKLPDSQQVLRQVEIGTNGGDVGYLDPAWAPN
jgi:hypothetical protein